MFAAYGDLIDALDFNVSVNGKVIQMGQDAVAAKGDSVTMTIRFRSPESTNREISPGDALFGVGKNPGVHHIDVIAGSVTGKIDPSSSHYHSAENSDAKVIASFTQKDWQLDKDGYHKIVYQFSVDKSMYFRLRGTALDYNEKGLTVEGEPQKWLGLTRMEKENEKAFRERFYDLIYKDVWFYSNPLFITLQ